MNDSTFLKLRFISWIEELNDAEVEQLIKDTQDCAELDRCFRYCVDVDCEYYSLLLLVRTPTKDFRKRVVEWISSISEEELKELLEKGVVCGQQSFCIKYCAATQCGFKRLITDLCAISSFVA